MQHADNCSLFVFCLQIPTFGFLYVAGWIGYVGRLYLNAVRRSVFWSNRGSDRGTQPNFTFRVIQAVPAADLGCRRAAEKQQEPVSQPLQQLRMGTGTGSHQQQPVDASVYASQPLSNTYAVHVHHLDPPATWYNCSRCFCLPS
jgi:hypothetical protein